MRKLICFLLVVAGLVTAAAYAGVPTNDLDPKVAVKLIGMRTGLNVSQIEVAYIVDGNVRDKDGFETTYVRRVATIHPLPEGGGQARRLVYYDMYWNDALGWFMSKVTTERTGDVIYRWSERSGATVVK